MLITFFFGASTSTDAFYVAFRIPNLFRRLLAEGSLSSTLVPFIKDEILSGNIKNFSEFRSKIFTILMLVLTILTIIFYYLSEPIIQAFAYGFDTESIKLAADMLSIMSPFLLFISLSAFNMGLLNANNNYLPPAFSPVIFNVVVIFVLIFSYFYLKISIYSISYAVLLGSLCQFIFLIPFVIKRNLFYGITFNNLIDSKISKFFIILGPQVLGLAIYNINILINTQFASFMEKGSVTYLYLSERLLEFPLGIFAVSIATTSLTKFSEMSSQGNLKHIQNYLNERLKFLFFLLIPCALVFILWGYEICNLLYKRGEFTTIDSFNTYKALFAYSVGLVFVGGVRVLTQVFYSIKNTKIPVFLSGYNLLINIFFCYLLSIVFNLGFFGLALSSSLSALILFFSLILNLKKKNISVKIFSLLKYLIFILFLSSVIIFLIEFLANNFSFFIQNQFIVLVKIFIFIILYLLFAYVFKVKELDLIRS